MGITDYFKGKKTLSELEEEEELLQKERAITQTKADIAREELRRKIMINRMKESGLTPKHFNYNWKAIYNWFDKMGGGKSSK